jgi:hypothetical protein
MGKSIRLCLKDCEWAVNSWRSYGRAFWFLPTGCPLLFFSWESDIGRRSVSITSRDVVLFNENGEDAKGQFVSNPAGKLLNR